MGMKKARAVKNKRGAVTGWATTCSNCGKPVQFKKGVRFWLGEAENKPDNDARCRDCWEAAKAQYLRKNRYRRQNRKAS
jgi:hypothetical protein